MPDWIVDAHHYFFDVDQFAYPWMVGPAAPLDRNYLPEHLEPHLTALGVQRTVLVQGGAERRRAERHGVAPGAGRKARIHRRGGRLGRFERPRGGQEAR